MSQAVTVPDVLAGTVSAEPSLTWVASMESRLDPDWHRGGWDATRWLFTGDPDNPQTWVFRCTIPGCPSYSDHQELYCRRCRRHYIRLGHPDDCAEQLRPTRDRLEPEEARRFSLAGLPVPLRTELLFALQVYTRNRLIVPRRVRRLVDQMPPGTASLLELPEAFDTELGHGERGLLRSLRAVLVRDRADFDGTDVTTGDVWDCGLLGLQAGTHRPYTSQLGTVLDFRAIHHTWLRELTKEYIGSTRPTVNKAKPVIKACAIASQPCWPDPTATTLTGSASPT